MAEGNQHYLRSCGINGTVRTRSQFARSNLHERIESLAHQLRQCIGPKQRCQLPEGEPPVVNNEKWRRSQSQLSRKLLENLRYFPRGRSRAPTTSIFMQNGCRRSIIGPVAMTRQPETRPMFTRRRLGCPMMTYSYCPCDMGHRPKIAIDCCRDGGLF